MTGPRQQRKSGLLAGNKLVVLAALGWTIFAGISAPQAAEDPLVINPDTGLAISGFDPVAYFSRQKAVLGNPQFELTQNGTVWQFLNEGNRSAFADHPEVYTPRYGGYDPVAIGRGVSVPGNPFFWAVEGDRLYLFYDVRARAEFLGNPGLYIENATRKWPDIARTLAR
jgi:hypothetical protein